MPVESEDQEFKELLQKYKEGQCTSEEIDWLESWYLHWNEQHKATLSRTELDEGKMMMWNSIQGQTRAKSIVRLWPRVAAVASIVLMLGVGLYFYRNIILSLSKDNAVVLSLSKGNNIIPGSNKAYLTLANGKVINLSGAKSGVIINASKLIYSDGTEVGDSGLRHAEPVSGSGNKLVTASTPRGGTYQVVLSDGTLVYLNAASSLKFPETFAGLKERKVTLKGEAYFVVKHDAAQPFKVQTDDQIVEDIGTEFNISSYSDEPGVKTTLLKGSVKIVAHENSVVLVPGQQSSLNADKTIKVIPANIEETMAWKNGYFRFNNEHIISVMKKISRWYNVEVQYQGNITSEGFYGAISRDKNIDQVLNVLEKTKGVHFKIEGRRITVME